MRGIKCSSMKIFIEKVVSFFRNSGFYFLLVACPVLGQVPTKKELTADAYPLWSSLLLQKLSDHGQWFSYTKRYDLVPDTLFVKSTATDKTFSFPRGVQGSFNGDEWFACMRGDTLQVQNLKTGALQLTTNVLGFAFAGNGKYLLLDLKAGETSHWLVVKTMQGAVVDDCKDVLRWKLNEAGNLLVYNAIETSGSAVTLLELDGNFEKKRLAFEAGAPFSQLVWQGTVLAFMKADSTVQKVFRYRTKEKQLLVFDARKWVGFPTDKVMAADEGSLHLSADGERVFFNLKETLVEPIPTKGVEVWHASDKQLYPNIKMSGVLYDYDKLAVWWPETGKFYQIADNTYPVATLSGDSRHAYVWDPLAYEPQSDYESPRDVYAVDLKTGVRKLVLKGHTGHVQTLLLSPNGNYVSYPKGGHWWVYDVAKGTHTNVTEKLGVPFYDVVYDRSGEVPLYGNPGWSSGDASILLYDQYDVWEVAADGSWSKRLTQGRELGITYRLQPTSRAQESFTGENDMVVGSYDLKKPLLLFARDLVHALSGYSVLDGKRGIRSLGWQSERITRFTKAAKSDAFVYIAERFDVSPHLMLVKDYASKPKQVLATNVQQEQYYWGKSERITYPIKGKEVSGSLFWPANYDARKKYPMVVHIYERQLGYLHDYVVPTVYNEGGFNITNLTAKGYFVLLPDIVYTEGEVGESATTCVLAAVDAVVAKGYIDEKSIGLEGHSFGGYETDFIVTQTNRFATAVSGSAFTDVVSSYLYIGGHYAKPDFWRFEHSQQRLGKSLFEKPKYYINNSPIMFANNVQTPLLAWTGAEDRHVNYYQSIEFYLALRRQHKKHTLLIYPGEGHGLMEAENQIDCTRKMEEWFGYYLKGEPAPSWMQEEPF